MIVGEGAGDREHSLADALHHGADERLDGAVGVDLCERLAHQGVMVGGSEKLLIDLARFVLASGTLEEIAVGLNDPERGTRLLIRLLVEIFGAQRQIEIVGNQRGMESLEVGEGLVAVEFVQRRERLLLIAFSGIAPGGEEGGCQFTDRRVGGLAEMLAGFGIVLETQIAQAQYDARHPVLAVEGEHPYRVFLGGIHVSFGDGEDENLLDQHRVVWVIAQRLLEIARREVYVAELSRIAAGKVASGERAAFFAKFITRKRRRCGKGRNKREHRKHPEGNRSVHVDRFSSQHRLTHRRHRCSFHQNEVFCGSPQVSWRKVNRRPFQNRRATSQAYILG